MQRSCSVADVAQLGEPIGLGGNDGLQGALHEPVGLLVKVDLHAYQFFALQLKENVLIGKVYEHAVIIHKVDCANLRQIGEVSGSVLVKEAYCLAILKVVWSALAVRACDLYDVSVERIVVAAANRKRIPAVSTLYFAADAHQLRLAAEGFSLVLILHAE